MLYLISNDDFVVKIDSFGAEVKSVLKKDGYKEYMWYGDSKYWGRTSPVLFPFVGSLKNKEFLWNGTRYPMGQHGFARDMEFELVEKKDDFISFCLKSNEQTLSIFPFDFELIIGYRLINNELKVEWTVYNPSQLNKMYFSIGAHPAFLCPIYGESDKTSYKLYFDGINAIHHHGNQLDSGLAIVDEDITLELIDNRATITSDFFDRCTYYFEGDQAGYVGLEDPEGNRIVDVIFDTPLFAIWSPEKKNAPFICIEPWYGRADSVDFNGSLEERAYTNTLEPLGDFNGGYSMIFY